MAPELTIHQCECAVCRTETDPEVAQHHRQMNLLLSRLNEPQRRWHVGLFSQKLGSPSDRQLSLITGLDAKTIRRGRRELEAGLADLPIDRQRREGGGRPAAEDVHVRWEHLGMTRFHCFSFVEDEPSKEALRKLVAQRNESCRRQLFFQEGHPQITGGFARIREKIPAFLNMAKAGLFTLALTDLDRAEIGRASCRERV